MDGRITIYAYGLGYDELDELFEAAVGLCVSRHLGGDPQDTNQPLKAVVFCHEGKPLRPGEVEEFMHEQAADDGFFRMALPMVGARAIKGSN